MPNIFEYFGILFGFFSKDHLPTHVHAKWQGYETKLVLVYEKGELIDVVVKHVSGKDQLPPKVLKKAITLVERRHNQILEKWTAFYIKKEVVKSERITQKL